MSIEYGIETQPRKTKKGMAIGATTLGLLAAGLSASVDRVNDSSDAQFETENKAAEAIALGYDCSLTFVEDFNRQPKPSETSDTQNIHQRTVVKVSVNLKERAAAQPYFKQYANDNSVRWKTKPSIKAWFHDSPIPTEHDQGKEFARGLMLPEESSTDDPADIQAFFAPKVNYPDGASASVYAIQQVNTADDEVRRYTVGYMYCGELKLVDGHWTMDPFNEPSKNHLLDSTDVHTEPY